MDDFITYQGPTNVGEVVHSVSATISTIFLFTRLGTKKGKDLRLWWDDYFLIASWMFLLAGNGCAASLPSYGFRVLQGSERGWTLMKCSASFFYLASGLGKTAFATTLIRLSSGGTRALLWAIASLVCAFSTAVTFVTWAAICGQASDVVAISRACIPQHAVIWIHTGNAIITLCTDFVLAYLPWRILLRTDLPRREKLATGLSMSLVGAAGILCVARLAILFKVTELQERKGEVDWTYGSTAVWILAQTEVAVYIVAQTIPLIRVLISRSSSETQIVRSVVEINGGAYGGAKGKGPATRGGGLAKGAAEGAAQQAVMDHLNALADIFENVELVQLPSGKIVTADSEEGKAFKASALR